MTRQAPKSLLVKEGPGREIYFGHEKRTLSCQVGKHKLRAEFFTEQPKDRGECGGAPGSRVTIWIDGTRLMGNQLFNNHCFEPLGKVSFRQSDWVRFVFEMCATHRVGYT